MPETRVSTTKEVDAATITSHYLLVIEQMNSPFNAEKIQINFNQQIKQKLEGCGIHGLIEQWPDTKDIKPEALAKVRQKNTAVIQHFRPDKLLIVEFRSMQYMMKFGNPIGANRYNYELILKSIAGQELWKSSIDILPSNISRGDVTAVEKPDLVGETLAETAFQNMRQDGLLPSCGDTATTSPP